MNEITDLENCPFCGSPAIFYQGIVSDSTFEPPMWGYGVKCTNDSCFNHKTHKVYNTINTASKAWNIRTNKKKKYGTLEKCPYCGADAYIHEGYAYLKGPNLDAYKVYSVSCMNDNCVMSDNNMNCTMEIKAIADWNLRNWDRIPEEPEE